MSPLLSLFLLLISSPFVNSKRSIFILAGQSNMSGRGGVADGKWDNKVPPESHPSPSILRLNSRLHWQLAVEPLHADIDVNKTCGVGPGLPFANAVKNSTSVSSPLVLGLVPCAIGGTRIEEWARGKVLYKNMIRRAKAAVRTGGGKIEAVLWYQGESDTVAVSDAMAYRERMERLVADVRADLGDPNLLFVQVALASAEGPYIELVRHAQIGLDVPNVALVDAKGLALNSDNLHLTSQAQVQLGEMLAVAYLNHTGVSAKVLSCAQ